MRTDGCSRTSDSNAAGRPILSNSISPATFSKNFLRDEALVASIAIKPIDELLKRALANILRLDVVYSEARKVGEPRVFAWSLHPRLVNQRKLRTDRR
jgi:hypothetical protein